MLQKNTSKTLDILDVIRLNVEQRKNFVFELDGVQKRVACRPALGRTSDRP